MKQHFTIRHDHDATIDELARFYAEKFVAVEARRIRPPARKHDGSAVKTPGARQMTQKSILDEIESIRSQLDRLATVAL